jgi:hypothetical protein
LINVPYKIEDVTMGSNSVGAQKLEFGAAGVSAKTFAGKLSPGRRHQEQGNIGRVNLLMPYA